MPDLGNPLSEMHLESLRYLAGKPRQPLPTITGHGNARLTSSDCLRPDDVDGPADQQQLSTPLNTLVVSSTVSSCMTETNSAVFPTLTGSNTLSSYTKAVGDGEGITGQNVLIGYNGTTYSGTCWQNQYRIFFAF